MNRNLFTFMAHMRQYDGYGYAAIKIAEALNAMAFGEPKVSAIDMTVKGSNGRSPNDLPETYLVRGTAVVFCVPSWWENITASQAVGYTMFEATRPPTAWIRTINEWAQMLLVPSQWNADVYRDAGVRIPVEIVPLGVDAACDFPLLPRPQNGNEPYTFLWSGTSDLRKGWDAAYKAFNAVFGRRTDVRLVLHFRKAPEGVRFRDPNVEVVTGKLSLTNLHALLQDADCFVYPSRGEGWGMPPREAAATGLPVIATDWSGLSANLSDWGIPLAVKGCRAAAYGVWREGEIGNWAEPDSDHLATLMETAVSSRDEMAAKGLAAAQWLRQHAAWQRTARALMAAVSLCQVQELEPC